MELYREEIMLFEIKNYSLKLPDLDKELLEKASLRVDEGEIVVLIGENGSGKSSFAMSLLGLPEYTRKGKVLVEGKNIIDLNIEESARAGLFVSFQSPPEIEGVSLFNFIHSAYKSCHPDSGLSSFKIRKLIAENVKKVGLNESFLERSTNLGFSGGERRKSEVLQMLTLMPRVAILDEVDSGLDIKSTQNIAEVLKNFVKESNSALLIISHSPEFIKKLSPDRIMELKAKKFVEVDFNEIYKFENDIAREK